MRFSTIVKLTFGALLLASPLALSACGPSKPATIKAELTPDNMPSGALWDGVYFNAVWGNLHIITSGNEFQGKWKRTDESAYGQMKGTTNGNIARFEWTEHTVGMVGPSASTSGRGYFRYTRPAGDNVDDRLIGEWGFGESEAGGGEWDAIKQRNKDPNFSEVTHDGDSEFGTMR